MTSHAENSHLKIHHARVLKTLHPTNIYISDVVLQINNRVPKLSNATPKICPFHYIVHVELYMWIVMYCRQNVNIVTHNVHLLICMY